MTSAAASLTATPPASASTSQDDERAEDRLCRRSPGELREEEYVIMVGLFRRHDRKGSVREAFRRAFAAQNCALSRRRIQKLHRRAHIRRGSSLAKAGDEQAQSRASLFSLPCAFRNPRQAQRHAQFERYRALAPRDRDGLAQKTANQFRLRVLLGEKLGAEAQQFGIEEMLAGFARLRGRVVEGDQSSLDFAREDMCSNARPISGRAARGSPSRARNHPRMTTTIGPK
jgi:hypothetical protein